MGTEEAPHFLRVNRGSAVAGLFLLRRLHFEVQVAQLPGGGGGGGVGHTRPSSFFAFDQDDSGFAPLRLMAWFNSRRSSKSSTRWRKTVNSGCKAQSVSLAFAVRLGGLSMTLLIGFSLLSWHSPSLPPLLRNVSRKVPRPVKSNADHSRSAPINRHC